MNRDEMIQAEAERQDDVAKRRAELQAEFDKIAAPVLEFRKIEARMKKIQLELASLTHHSSATHASYRRNLERAIPPALVSLLNNARAELGQRHSDATAEAIDRLAAVRRWVDEVDAARRDPAKGEADLNALVERGRELHLTGAVKAFDDPAWVTQA